MTNPILTQRQEQFCLGVIQGLCAKEAYLEAGYHAKNTNTANVCASQLLRRPNIQKRIQEIRSQVLSPSIADQKEVQEALSVLVRYGKEHPKEGGRIASMAAAELSKHKGWYAPTRRDVTTHGEHIIAHITVENPKVIPSIQRVLAGELPKHEVSHDPVAQALLCEGTVSENVQCATSQPIGDRGVEFSKE